MPVKPKKGVPTLGTPYVYIIRCSVTLSSGVSLRYHLEADAEGVGLLVPVGAEDLEAAYL